jgi:hypothetical protein
MNALDIITAAYEACNRLSPGESLNADDAARGFKRLNLLIDEMAGTNAFLYKNNLTSAVQSGPITLGAGAWAAIGVGDNIFSVTANNLALSRITMQQYNEIYQPTLTGLPSVWAQDGDATIYLWPIPAGHTIKLQTRSAASEFADLNTTDYTLPAGYESALGAALAVRLAPTVLGSIPSYLLAAEKRLMGNINKYEPAIVNVESFTNTRARVGGLTRFNAGY